MLLYTCNKNKSKIKRSWKNMITRSIEKVTAKITDGNGQSVEKTYYGANVTATKIKKSYEAETGVKAVKVSMDSEVVKASMTEAEFARYGKVE
jgi:hypothetical protein